MLIPCNSLFQNPSRALVFVNSIKTARRLDGLLRALGMNCRTVHSQLQQRQRLRALDTFRSSPVGILVATDIAARGLDIPKVQFVVHYDSARSVQVRAAVLQSFYRQSVSFFLFTLVGVCSPLW